MKGKSLWLERTYRGKERERKKERKKEGRRKAWGKADEGHPPWYTGWCILYFFFFKLYFCMTIYFSFVIHKHKDIQEIVFIFKTGEVIYLLYTCRQQSTKDIASRENCHFLVFYFIQCAALRYKRWYRYPIIQHIPEDEDYTARTWVYQEPE